VAEPGDELAVGALKRHLRIHAGLPCDIGDREEEISQLLLDGRALSGPERIPELGHFFLNLPEQILGPVPVEADPGRLGRDPERLQKSRQRSRDSRKERRIP